MAFVIAQPCIGEKTPPGHSLPGRLHPSDQGRDLEAAEMLTSIPTHAAIGAADECPVRRDLQEDCRRSESFIRGMRSISEGLTRGFRDRQRRSGPLNTVGEAPRRRFQLPRVVLCDQSRTTPIHARRWFLPEVRQQFVSNPSKCIVA
jgi:hypothetical protein